MVKVTIDGEVIEVTAGMNVLQACEQAGKEIPRFCYHDKLKIAGNCRMCLVEIEKTPKLQASCAYPVAEGMVIKTDTQIVKDSREAVIEFLLINHPLDCPICDEAGECDLQDQTFLYGKGANKFHENKRSIEEKDFGPLIKSFMTRCIHCTRCIRFSTQIAGVEELGATGRGEDMEVGTYVGKAVSSELSGNMIDICPVGALTSRPYAFKARSWELVKTESIDVLDAVGSNIRIDVRGKEVVRILPRLNEQINEEWISDKTRFACDGLKIQRLGSCFVKKTGKLEQATWDEALLEIKNKISKVKPDQIAAIVGNLSDVESAFAFKSLMDKIGSPNLDCRTNYEKLDASNRSSYLFNTSIARIEEADLCLIVGANPRHDAPLVNARIRKRFLKGDFEVASIGGELDLTFKVNNLGDDPKILEEILDGSHKFSLLLKKAKNPMIILGEDAISRKDGEAIISISQKIAEKYNAVREDWNGFNILHKAAGRVGALDVGFVPGKGGKDLSKIISSASEGDIKVIIMLGGDEIDMPKFDKAFVIYIGHHGDKIANNADVILPSSAYTEKDAIYVNLEGRPQKSKRALFAPGEAKEDTEIINLIAGSLGLELGFKSFSDLRVKMIKQYPHLGKISVITNSQWKIIDSKVKLSSEKIKNNKYNFYMTDPISRASKTMAQCSRQFYLEKEKVE